MSEENIFYFFTKEVEFQESDIKGALVEATAMELNKVSGSGNVYQIDEGPEIAKSLIGKSVFYGTDWKNQHENPLIKGKEDSKAKPVGFVETAKVVGNKIKVKIRITAQSMIEALKQGVKYLFSVGGKAISETIKEIAGKFVHILHGARCNHLQMLDLGTTVGFPNAKMEKLIEINETVMICEGGLCHCAGRPPKPPKRRIRIIDVEETLVVTGKGTLFSDEG